jgi:hypothetical protein
MQIKNRRRPFWLMLALAAVTLVGSAYAALPASGAQSSDSRFRERTIRLVQASEVPQITVVDLGAPGLSPGDHVVIVDKVKRTNGSPAGTMSQECTLIKVGANLFTSSFECTSSFDLKEGDISAQGPFVPALAEQTNAITGGTGEFKTARGEAVISAEEDQIVLKLFL